MQIGVIMRIARNVIRCFSLLRPAWRSFSRDASDSKILRRFRESTIWVYALGFTFSRKRTSVLEKLAFCWAFNLSRSEATILARACILSFSKYGAVMVMIVPNTANPANIMTSDSAWKRLAKSIFYLKFPVN
jgi:hypothetical protein